MEIAQNNLFGLLIGPGDVTVGEVVQGVIRLIGKGNHRILPRLAFQAVKLDTGTQHPGGGAGFKPAKTHPQLQQGGRQLGGGEHAVRAAFVGYVPPHRCGL